MTKNQTVATRQEIYSWAMFRTPILNDDDRVAKAPKAFGGGRKPSERPTKICPVCGLPFAWRKSWRNNWEGVIYCSDQCRMNAKLTK